MKGQTRLAKSEQRLTTTMFGGRTTYNFPSPYKRRWQPQTATEQPTQLVGSDAGGPHLQAECKSAAGSAIRSG
eukprot:CAMPEP_0204369998 /NCGR_PEP_ID=MMETSP0469-20131031/45390_1 /ASSEMBLY_ACC=CAM_ASM_000384 /TAXON_ID=2969 /ORGANISM="Oxyrrhis marina" /LENGTH=72 /DNA_ID=CAMNT_0051359835 /DNA_START=19 /DNA_END=234 /DNA_ORIENTATION=+